MTYETNLPAKLEPGALIPASPAELVPALIADAGDATSWRYIDFFTANIRNPNTRRAYSRACVTFFAWRDERGRILDKVRPFDVASYVEARQQTPSAPDVSSSSLQCGCRSIGWSPARWCLPTRPPPCAAPSMW